MNLLHNRYNRLALLLGVLCYSVAFGQARKYYPNGIAGDGKGKTYLSDRKLPGIWELADGKLKVVHKGSKKIGGALNAIQCIATDKNGDLLIGDSATRGVHRLKGGKLEPVLVGRVSIPMGIAVNDAGDIFVADLDLNQIWKVPASGDPAVFAKVPAPAAMTFDSNKKLCVVSRNKETQLLRISDDGKSVEPIIKGRQFAFPNGIAAGPKGELYVADGFGKAIWKVTGDQAKKWATGEPLVNPVAVIVQGADVWIVDPRSKTPLIKASTDGKLTPVETAKLQE